MPELFRFGDELGLDVRQRRAAVQLRLTAAEQVEVGAVDEQQ